RRRCDRSARLPDRRVRARRPRHRRARRRRDARTFRIEERTGAIDMIGVKKISHASYETPALDKQVEYYTDILGLTLIARDKEAAYLANTVEHHSVILRAGSHPRCTRIGFQLGPDDDLDAFEKQTAAHGLHVTRKKDPEPTIEDMVSFEDPKGTVMEVF